MSLRQRSLLVARVWVFLLAALGCARAAPALPLRGELKGELQIAALADTGLKWRMEAGATGLRLNALRPGLAIEIEVFPLAGAWGWRLERGELDLAELWPTLRQKIGPAAAGWSASGRVLIGGEGAWSPEAGPTGELRLALREGWARSDEPEVELVGVELDVSTRDLAARGLPQGQVLRVAKISAGGVVLSRIEAKFGLNPAQVLEVAGVEAEVLGGSVTLKPFSLPLGAPSLRALAEVNDISLAEAARMAPWAVTSASGRLRGRVEVAWDPVGGVRIRDGGLSIVKRDAAEFRLAPSPGFLTGSLPRRFALLPRKWGRWTESIGPSNPAYAPLRAIEMGEVGLRIESLDFVFRPQGETGERSATVQVVARPTRRDLVDELRIDVNFHGPLADALALGLNERVRLNFR